MKTFLLLLFISLSISAREPIRTIIVSGQSNSDGRAETKDIPKDTDLNFDNFYFYHGNASGNAHESCPSNELITLRPGSGSLYKGKNHFGIEIGTAMVLREKFPNEKFLIIKYAKGGSSLFTDWDLKKGPHLKKLRETVKGAYAAIREKGYEPDIRAFLWHQGESDSKKDRVDSYNEKLTLFLNQMKNDFSSTMAYAIGQINLAQKIEPELSGKVMKAQEEVAKSFGKSVLVPSEGLSLKDDQMHFDTEGMIALGKRYGNAILPYMAKSDIYKLWPQGPPDNWIGTKNEEAVRSGGVTRYSGVKDPMITYYPVKEKNRPVVLVCPGGGYAKLAYDKEGT
ncbi:MAG: sialate O-acetylesterase, partial [Lentisphaeraceae bacterium]|nr:sialate O-acetylesterase [Lentisphaeraceae bacterium]